MKYLFLILTMVFASTALAESIFCEGLDARNRGFAVIANQGVVTLVPDVTAGKVGTAYKVYHWASESGRILVRADRPLSPQVGREHVELVLVPGVRRSALRFGVVTRSGPAWSAPQAMTCR